ncbi:MAG: hypothetical protein ACREDO_05550 [Methyloceanibacter sp.]
MPLSGSESAHGVSALARDAHKELPSQKPDQNANAVPPLAMASV